MKRTIPTTTLKTILGLAAVLVFPAAFPAGLTGQETGTAAEIPGNISYSIRFFDKQIYYQDSPIRLKAEIQNNSARDFHFQVSDRRVFNFDFGVYTLKNRRLKYAEDYTRKRALNQPVFFREATLGPGEEYSFIISLRDYVSLEETGMYYVESSFFPRVTPGIGQAGSQLTSNRLTLSIRPGSAEESADTGLMVREDTEETLKQTALPPDQVVSYTLNALQEENMDQFMLYLDLESLYLQSPGQKRRYLGQSEENRRQILERYREDLQEGRTEYSLMERPSRFTILRTNYTPREGSVIVREEFQYQDITEIREYTYYLEHRESIWKITQYEVQNLGSR